MNDILQRRLSSLEKCIAIQRDCVDPRDKGVDYMHGMLNGLICAHAIASNTEAEFLDLSRRRGKTGPNIRYKNRRKIKGT